MQRTEMLQRERAKAFFSRDRSTDIQLRELQWKFPQRAALVGRSLYVNGTDSLWSFPKSHRSQRLGEERGDRHGKFPDEVGTQGEGGASGFLTARCVLSERDGW